MTGVTSEVESRASFSLLRYAQCWEDADVLLAALDIQPGDSCFAIASAGDNALAMLSRGPQRVVAVDLNPAQLACIELRIAAYRELEHNELLRLMGSRPGNDRLALYRRCRSLLSRNTRSFWDARAGAVAGGIGSAGKFENYFRLFRTRVLPAVHGRDTVERLFEPRPRSEREAFYEQVWSNWRWRRMFRIFFSRFVMGWAGRDPSFFKYVEGCVSDRILVRARHALIELDPSQNPYLQWIFFGSHPTALPYALRAENFDAIRSNLDRLECRVQSLEDFLHSDDARSVNSYNLSDVFEYMSEENYTGILERITAYAAPGTRIAYWNLLVPRTRPETLAKRLRPRPEAARLHQADKAFFYSNFIVEEVVAE
ncbi:MAG: DUF3419 family protein [Proteobacteria bacterium]|nr:DUF3419 family protein [Pseudomonadota bacterium]